MKIKIIKKLEEMSTTGGIQGVPGSFGSSKDIEAFNKKQEREQRLKGHRIDEMMSSSATKEFDPTHSVTSDEVFAGQKDRMAQQGLKNENIEESPEIEEAKRILDEKGYVAWGIISSGQFGSVFHAETEDGQGVAIKTLWTKAGDKNKKIRKVTIDDLNREVRNYRVIGNARNKDADIAKHFPEVFDTFIENDSSGNPMAFIVMEKLKPLSADAKQHLPDPAYYASKKNVALGRPAADLKNMAGESQTLEKRAEMFFTENDKAIDKIRNDLLRLIYPNKRDIPIVKGSINNIALGPLQRYAQISQTNEADKLIDDKVSNIFFKSLPEKTVSSYLANKDVPNLQNSMKQLDTMIKDYSDNKFVTLSILHIAENYVRALRGSGIFNVDFALEIALRDLQKSIRMHTLTHSSYKRKYMRDPKQSSGGRGVEGALMKIRPVTGLFPQDLHWGNFLEREDGTIVVVDLGLFKNTGDFRKDKQKLAENKTITIKILR